MAGSKTYNHADRDMEKKPNHEEHFSLSQGGPFYNALVKLSLHKQQTKLGIVCLCITWIPLVIITAIEGTLITGVQLPFFQDAAMQARVLVALPMLIMMTVAIDSRVNAVLKYITEGLMSGEERDIVFPAVLSKARKLTNSTATDVILFAAVIVITVSFVNAGVYSSLKDGVISWMTSPYSSHQTLSVAGYWSVFISIPIFQFLFIRWLWRYCVWVLLLFRLSRACLNLLPTHADRAGGLGIIMQAQSYFSLVFVVGSVILSGQFIVQIIRHPESFNVIRNEAIGYMIICLVFILTPLFFFTSKLVRIKNIGLERLSILGAILSSKFEKQWINDMPIEKRIEEQQVDPSMLYDYSGLYGQLQQLRTVPVTLRDIAGLVTLLFAPFVPILFIHFSVGELLQKIGNMLA